MDFNVFRYWIFLKIYQNMGQKLGSNRCPLFTMLTKQNSSMFCVVSFVKKNLSFCLLNLLNIHSSKDLVLFSFFFLFFFFLRSHQAISLNQNQNLCGWANLRSRPAIPFNQNQYLVCGWANLRSRPAIPFNQNQYPVCGWANLRSHPAIPFNQNQHEIPSGDLIKPKLKKCV